MNDDVPSIVHIVEDDASARSALVRLLRTIGYDVAEYPSAGEFLRRQRPERTECVLIDVQLPDMTGLELQRTLADAADRIPVVFLTARGDISMSVQAMKLGAVDFLTKPVDHVALLQAVGGALARNRDAREDVARLQEMQTRYATLTPREREVLSHVVAGELNKQIAANIGAAERTVKAHRHEVMKKMQAGSLADLIRMAYALNLFSPKS